MARTKKPRLENFVAIVIDASSSISTSGLTNSVISAFNDIKKTLVAQSKLTNQDTYVTVIVFDETVHVPLYKHANVNMIPDLDRSNYQPGGRTALFDAKAKAIEIFDSVPVKETTSFLVITLTDGEENASVFTKAFDLSRMMIQREDRGNWTFAFQLPVGRRDSFCRQFGISLENVSEWETTIQGTQEMAEKTSGGISNFYAGRAVGEKMSKNFFEKVTPDLSRVNVKCQLDDIAGQFRVFTVPAETRIDNFVTDKTGNYVPGSAYYQLVKPEKVQPSKGVLIQEKGTKKKIYGGPAARDLIGLPDGKHAKITPGNHDNYDIFIQSKSINRILPRGSKLLVVK